jgi:hypothetical protein
MAKPYSQDLRNRVIDAVRRGKMSRRAAARHYAVSESAAVRVPTLTPPSVEIDVGGPAPNMAVPPATGTTPVFQLPGSFHPEDPGAAGGDGAGVPPSQVWAEEGARPNANSAIQIVPTTNRFETPQSTNARGDRSGADRDPRCACRFTWPRDFIEDAPTLILITYS